MADLDTLRPEVREIVESVDDDFEFVGRTEIILSLDDWQQVRAELLRLADENARLTGQNRIQYDFLSSRQCPDHAGKWERGKCLQCAIEKAEAELAALKARIADAPITQVTRMAAIGGGGYEWAGCRVPDEWNAKCVRLLVEE